MWEPRMLSRNVKCISVFRQKSKHFWVVLAAQFQDKLFWTEAEAALASTYFHSALNSYAQMWMEGKSNLTVGHCTFVAFSSVSGRIRYDGTMSLNTSRRDTMTSFLTVTATHGSVSISMALNSFSLLIWNTWGGTSSHMWQYRSNPEDVSYIDMWIRQNRWRQTCDVQFLLRQSLSAKLQVLTRS